MKRQLLDWCILLSAIANISSAGILLYVAQHMFDVHAISGSVNAYMRVSDRDPIPIKIVDVDRNASAIEVRGNVGVEGEVSIKEKPSLLGPIPPRVRTPLLPQ
jgi:hypothetical protein